MYTHERCFLYRYGGNSRKNNLRYYCQDGYTLDKVTGKVTDSPICIDWYRSCYKLDTISARNRRKFERIS